MSAYVLDTVLRLAHPFAPFVTETIWQALSWHDNLLVSDTWPELKECNELSAAEFGRLIELISEVRYVVSELPGNERYPLLYMDDSLIADNADLVHKLARLKSVEYVDHARGLRLAASGRDAWLDISSETLYEHQSNLEKRLAEMHRNVEALEARLGNEAYVAKAPATLVEESRQLLTQTKETAIRLQSELTVISENNSEN